MTDEVTYQIESSEKKFRFQNQRCMLTYKSHIDKEEYKKWLSKKWEYKTIYIAHELGDTSHNYKHTQVVVDFGSAKQTRNCRFFAFNLIHPKISIIKDKLAFKISCKYLCKEDKTVKISEEDDLTDIEQIWACPTIADALKYAKLKDVMAIIAAYEHRPEELPEPRIHENDFYPWQTQTWERIQEEPDSRSVIWIHEDVGNIGKTQFAKWACLKHPEKCVLFNNIGKIADFAMNMKTFKKKGWRGDTVFLNLSRAYSEKTNLYEVCEIICDGYIMCTKYTGGALWLQDLHIVVLANFAPQTNKLSEDRWEIYGVNKEKKLERTRLAL